MNLKQGIVFAILMENQDGVTGKHPNYIEEKLRATQNSDQCYRLLDRPNSKKLWEWLEKWKVVGIFTDEELREIKLNAGLISYDQYMKGR